MRWQDSFQIDGGNRVGFGTTVLVVLLVMLTNATLYFHQDRTDAQAVFQEAREQIASMKMK